MNILTLNEAARQARCSKAYLRKVLAGKLPDVPPPPVFHIGSKVLIREEALSDWLLLLERKEREAQYASGLFAALADDNDPETIGGA